MIWRLWFAMARLVRAVRACGGERMDTTWLRSQGLQEMRQGWDGPRWRTPAERAAMTKVDRRKATVVPMRRAAR